MAQSSFGDTLHGYESLEGHNSLYVVETLGLMLSELYIYWLILVFWGFPLSMIYFYISRKFQGLDQSFPNLFLLTGTT